MKKFKLTSTDLRAEIDGTGIELLIGKWIQFQGKSNSRCLIIGAETQERDDKPFVGVVAFSTGGLLAANLGQRPNHKDVIAGELVFFSKDENKGHMKYAGQTLAFSVIEQPEVPPSLKLPLQLIRAYPVGETIDLPNSIRNNHTPRIPFKEAMIIGYSLSPGERESIGKWMGWVVVTSATRPLAHVSLVPVSLLVIENVIPPRRSLPKASSGNNPRFNS